MSAVSDPPEGEPPEGEPPEGEPQPELPNPIPDEFGFHQLLPFVGQLRYMGVHCERLLAGLDNRIALTEQMAPSGREGRQTYELHRPDTTDMHGVRERWLELLIWRTWRASVVNATGQPFFGDACRFIQSFQVPLQRTREDRGWGKIDLLGATSDSLPAVLELKQEDATDPPLRMLAEALAYACAVRKAWRACQFRVEWVKEMVGNGRTVDATDDLDRIPLLLLAPTVFWKRTIGTPGVRTRGKVPEAAWPAFHQLADQCVVHGFPVYCVQFDTERAEGGGEIV
jgi:hypothetical protein